MGEPGDDIGDEIYAPDRLADLAMRLERHARSHDPRDLWPGLTEAARVAAAREIERVTRDVLTGELHVRLDAANEHDPYAIAIAANTTGMGPLLGLWDERGLIDARADVRRRLRAHLAHARRRANRIEREVLPALDALLAHGITPVVLKGFSTARTCFEEPGVRRMSDVDLLVAPDRVSDAMAALRAAHFHPSGQAMSPYKQDWIAEGVDERVYSVELSDERTKWAVELHASLDRTFHPGAVARLDLVRDHTEPLVVATRELLTLTPTATLLTLACHCSHELGSSRLLRLVEIIRVVRGGRVDWTELHALLHQSGAARFAYPALALAEQLAPGTIDARILSLGAAESTWAARHTVARLVPAGGSPYELGLLRQVMWMRGPLAILHRLLRLIVPATHGARAADVLPGWRVRLRQLRAGLLSIRAPDERRRLSS